MNSFTRRRLSIMFLLVTVLFISLSSFSLPVLAGDPPPFDIRVVPQANDATAGRVFTYTVVVTHTGQAPLKDVWVSVKTPADTTYHASTLLAEQKWYAGGYTPGEPGEIFWLTPEPVAPGDVVVIELGVNVLSDAGPQLVNDEYLVTTLADYDVAAVSGPPVITRVLAPAPAAPEAPPEPAPTRAAARPSLAPTARVQGNGVRPASAAPVEAPADLSLPPAAASVVPLGTAGLALLSLALGLVWFLRRR